MTKGGLHPGEGSESKGGVCIQGSLHPGVEGVCIQGGGVGQTPSRELQNTVNKRAVRILLECILVKKKSGYNEHPFTTSRFFCIFVKVASQVDVAPNVGLHH